MAAMPVVLLLRLLRVLLLVVCWDDTHGDGWCGVLDGAAWFVVVILDSSATLEEDDGLFRVCGGCRAPSSFSFSFLLDWKPSIILCARKRNNEERGGDVW